MRKKLIQSLIFEKVKIKIKGLVYLSIQFFRKLPLFSFFLWRFEIQEQNDR